MAPTADEINKWHRWNAIECNNFAWDLIEQGEIAEADRDQLLNAAHAARFHWLKVGNAANDIAADHLLAIAHARVGSKELAKAIADRCLAASEKTELSTWGAAFTQLVAAYCNHCVGNGVASQSHLQKAVDLARAFEDEGDRKHFLFLIDKLPGIEAPSA